VKKLTPETSAWLIRSASQKKIKKVLFQMDPNKAPNLMVSMFPFVRVIGRI